MDALHALAARYCVRKDARGLLELWMLATALAGAIVFVIGSLRRGIDDRTRRRLAWLWAGVLTFFLLTTVSVAATIFFWCYESAAPSLGFVPANAGKGIDATICLSSQALDLIGGWIVIVVTCIGAVGLFALGIRSAASVARRALCFAGAAFVLLFAIADGGLMIFGMSWCQSSRLF